MKTLLLLGFLLVAFYPGFAQSSAAPGAAATRADSVAVLRQLFYHSRKTERFSTALFVFLAGTNASHFDTAEDGIRRPIATVGLGASSAGLFLSVFEWIRFNHRHEAAAVQRLELGKPLPHYVQRRFALAWAKEQTKQRTAGTH